jgi:hypothetical protein
VGFGEDRSSGLWLTVVQAPWGLAVGVQSTMKLASTWLLTAWCGTKSSSNSANSVAHLAILLVALGLRRTILSGYEVTTCHIPKFSFRNVNHFSRKKLKISKKNSFILN